MILKHVALVSTSEKKAEKFYGKLLGLRKVQPKYLPPSLSKTIFNIDAEIKIINFIGKHIRFEIFIDPQKNTASRPIEHICLEIEDREALLKRCQALDIKMSLVSTGKKTLTFISDDDNNLFEIKNK